jgi:hypothetical protein
MVMVMDPVLVLVAAADEARLEQLCEQVVAIDGCSAVGALGGRAALRHVVSRYELPTGCPDVVVLDSGLDGLEPLHAALDETCPGVKRLVAGSDPAAFADQLRQVAELVQRSFVR